LTDNGVILYHYLLMLEDLPEFIDLAKLAKQNATLKGQVKLEQLTRLQTSLCDTQGEIHIDWALSLDRRYRPIIEGRLTGVLHIECQRCLQPMQWAMNAHVALVVFTEGQTEADIPEGYEALVLTESPTSLKHLVEDEIILALPIMPVHEGDCPSNNYQLSDTAEQDELPEERYNPFQVLEKLKKH